MNDIADLPDSRPVSLGHDGTSDKPGEATVPMTRLALALSLRFVLILLMGMGLHLAGLSLLWTNLGIIAVDVITLAVLSSLMRREGRGLRDLYAPIEAADITRGLLFSVIVVIGFFVTNYLANIIVYQGPPPSSALDFMPPLWLGVSSLVVMPLTIAIAEEGLYRAYLLPRLGSHMQTGWALLLMSASFGLQHAGFCVPNEQAMLAKVLNTFFAGFIFGGLWLWKRRAVPLVIGHWLLDLLFLGLPVLYMSLAS